MKSLERNQKQVKISGKSAVKRQRAMSEICKFATFCLEKWQRIAHLLAWDGKHRIQADRILRNLGRKRRPYRKHKPQSFHTESASKLGSSINYTILEQDNKVLANKQTNKQQLKAEWKFQLQTNTGEPDFGVWIQPKLTAFQNKMDSLEEYKRNPEFLQCIIHKVHYTIKIPKT